MITEYDPFRRTVMKRLLFIQTTAFSEENFVIKTDLTDIQIRETLSPIKQSNGENCTNHDYFNALKEAHPNALIEWIDLSNAEYVHI